MDKKFEAFKDVIQKALKDAGATLQNAQQELDTFFERIEPAYAEAIATNDAMSLGMFRDRLVLLAGRASFKTLHRNQQVVMAAAMTAMRLLRVAVLA